MQLENGTMITGINSQILHESAALILNAIKALAGIPDSIDLIPNDILHSISSMKRNILSSKGVSLDVDEVLIALSVSAASNPAAEAGIKQLKNLRGADAHLTHIPANGDEAGLRKLGINLTSNPTFATKQMMNK